MRLPKCVPRKIDAHIPLRMSAKRLLLHQSAKAGGGATPGICECEYHASAYDDRYGTTLETDYNIRYTERYDGQVIDSCTINTSETCCVLVVGTIVSLSTYDVTDFELEQPSGTIVVDQEDETRTEDVSLFHYSCWQVLPAGNYFYHLVNRSGATRRIIASQIKAVAFNCTGPPCACEYHASRYDEFVGTTITNVYDRDSFNVFDGGTIESEPITITDTCCVFVVGTILSRDYAVTDFELERPLGNIVVDQEDETVIAGGATALYHYSSWEVLAPETYTYYLVNRSGLSRPIMAVQLKIIAVHCVLA